MNIMITSRILIVAGVIGVLGILIGCSNKGDSGQATTASVVKSDRDLIQEALTEAAVRWHYGDKAVLYDNELEYLQDKYNFDDYLTFRQIEFAEADTVEAINVQNITFYGRDSALAAVEIVFKGPSGKISRDHDKYMMYYHRGRWIRPTVGSMDIQREYNVTRRQADSAAEAEAKEDSGK